MGQGLYGLTAMDVAAQEFLLYAEPSAGFVLIITAILIPITIDELLKSMYTPEIMMIQMIQDAA